MALEMSPSQSIIHFKSHSLEKVLKKQVVEPWIRTSLAGAAFPKWQKSMVL